MYAKTSYGPGNIAALQSGIGLTYGPTISSNDPGSPQSAGGSHGAYNIPAVSGCCGMGAVPGVTEPARPVSTSSSNRAWARALSEQRVDNEDVPQPWERLGCPNGKVLYLSHYDTEHERATNHFYLRNHGCIKKTGPRYASAANNDLFCCPPGVRVIRAPTSEFSSPAVSPRRQVPVRPREGTLKGLLGLALGECDENCKKWVWYGVGGVAIMFLFSWLHDKYQYPTPMHY